MNKKIKVLQVIPRLGFGGAETGCYDLAHFLPEKGAKSYIVTSGGPLLKFINKKKVGVFRFPVHSKNPIMILLNAVFISLIVLVYNINIIHARSRAPAWSCLIATKFTEDELNEFTDIDIILIAKECYFIVNKKKLKKSS